jgi:hypothetical protein
VAVLTLGYVDRGTAGPHWRRLGNGGAGTILVSLVGCASRPLRLHGRVHVRVRSGVDIAGSRCAAPTLPPQVRGRARIAAAGPRRSGPAATKARSRELSVLYLYVCVCVCAYVIIALGIN